MKILLSISDIRKNYGARAILDGATASFGEDQKIGVIGRNGAGKSTLCRIITGEESADGGSVVKSPSLRLSYLRQNDPYDLNETVMDFLMRSSGKESWQCGKVAGQFELKHALLETKIAELSGGYRTRVKLASMLLEEPNFLILDEPTNYLDLKTLMLLEEFLSEYRGAFMIVSHDREFLRKTCDQTLEIESGKCTLYPGEVEDYLIFKEENKEQAMSYNRNVEAKQRQLQQFVDRFRAKASKAAQARSKMKQIEKLKKIEVDHPLSNVNIKLPSVEKRNAIAMRCMDLSIGYPQKTIASFIDLEIYQGEHVAVLGDNGQGKTTFLRTLAGDLEKIEGQVKWGHELNVAYYAQHVYSSLNPDMDVQGYLAQKAHPSVMSQEILNLAGSFLFKGDDVKKKISVLSGGERSRCCLAGMLLSKSQVLLLDEPTNHLDFETVEALGRALKDYQGTVFFISHDRTFVNLLATKIIEVKNSRVKLYDGNYEEYVYHLRAHLHDEDENVGTSKKSMPEKNIPELNQKTENTAQQEWLKKKETDALRKKLQSKLKRVEEDIATYKKEHQSISDEFAANSLAWTRDKQRRYDELESMLTERESLWVDLSQQLESLSL